MFHKSRVISSGEFKESKGGIYNPSVISKEGNIICLTRVENISEDKRENLISTSAQGFLSFLNDDLKPFKSYHLFQQNFPINFRYRIEDFRIFEFRNKIYASHPIVINNRINQAISLIDLYEKTITLVNIFESPFMREAEKNWGFFSKDNNLYVLYSISPWVIFKITDYWNLELVYRDNYYGVFETNEMISLSSLPIEYDNNFLVIVHSRNNKKYIQGSVIFDNSFVPLYYSDIFLKGGKEKGLRKNVLYISSCFKFDNQVHLFYGEGDTHSSRYSIAKTEFDKLIYKNKIHDN